MSELKRGLHSNQDDPASIPKTDDGSEGDTAEKQQTINNETDVDRPDVVSLHREEAPPRTGRRPKLLKRRKKKRRKRSRRLTLAVLPTLLTLGNAVCGLAAIAVAISPNLPWDDEKKLLVAGVLIFGGMLFDALDGSAARMTGQESRFGAELDSLCDAITFGTAPAVIVWRSSDGSTLPPKLFWAIGVLFALCVLIRLARFNVETNEDDTHEGFDGLPSPAAAGTIAAFAIALPELTVYANDPWYHPYVNSLAAQLQEGSQLFILVLTLALAYLMVSRFQYPHVFQQYIRGRQTPHQIGRAMFVVIGALVFNWLVLPMAFCYYAFGSPVRTLLDRWRRRQPGEAGAA